MAELHTGGWDGEGDVEPVVDEQERWKDGKLE